MKKLLLTSACFALGILPVFAQNTPAIAEDVLSPSNLQELGIRFIINLTAVFILIRFIYFVRHQNKAYLFTLILFNSVNFLICFLLSNANLEVGFAFGLFAIFSIMRYRTVTVPIREMGYLFVCVALGLINSLATAQDYYVVLICSNVFIIALPFILDRNNINLTGGDTIITQDITYERIDLIKPELRSQMIADLSSRTGLPIHKVDIVNIDLVQDVAIIKAHYILVENATAIEDENYYSLEKNKEENTPINYAKAQ